MGFENKKPTKRVMPALVYEKQYGARAYYIEAINKERKTLQIQSSYINDSSGGANQLSLPDNHGLNRMPDDIGIIQNNTHSVNL